MARRGLLRLLKPVTVHDRLVAAMRDSRIPGAALGILAGDREEHATFGVASLSSLRPVTDSPY